MNALHDPIRIRQIAMAATLAAVMLAAPFLAYVLFVHLWALACWASAGIIAGMVIITGLSHDLIRELDERSRRFRM
jgi:hypothetical protein